MILSDVFLSGMLRSTAMIIDTALEHIS